MNANRNDFSVFNIMILLVMIAALAVVAISSFNSAQTFAREKKVGINCETLKRAADYFFVMSNGRYPNNTQDKLSKGVTFLQLVSDPQLFINPFTGAADQPIDGRATKSGQVGYMAIDNDGDGEAEGYEITGFGQEAQIVTLTSGQ